MREWIGTVLAALSIAGLIWAAWIVGIYMEDTEGTWGNTYIPSERTSWPNPEGYGLAPETEEYKGVFY